MNHTIIKEFYKSMNELFEGVLEEGEKELVIQEIIKRVVIGTASDAGDDFGEDVDQIMDRMIAKYGDDKATVMVADQFRQAIEVITTTLLPELSEEKTNRMIDNSQKLINRE